MRRAPAFGLAAVAVATLTLSGCTKPTPTITVFSGTNSVHTEALCWAESGTVKPGECLADVMANRDVSGVPVLGVAGGNVVGISVDPQVAEAGWTIAAVGGQPITPTPLTTNYFRLTLDQIMTEKILLQITAGGDQTRGVWVVQLDPTQS